jgi:hypothetical protein
MFSMNCIFTILITIERRNTMFTKDSNLVKIWVSLVLAGVYTTEQVPKMMNLKECVTEVMNAMVV